MNYFFKLNNILIIFILIILVWITQVLFLNQAAQLGMNGWDDWVQLFNYDSNRIVGDSLINKDIIGNIYILQETYYIGVLKAIFGLHLASFKLFDLLLKSLAALSSGYLVFKLTKDKLFAFLTLFFFVIFPSTAGLLNSVVSGLNHLVIVFMCFSIYFYIESFKTPKKILLASLFFLLAFCAGPARAYLLLPIPLTIELIRLRKEFKPFVFLRRLLIFYFLPFVLAQSSSGNFDPFFEIIVRLKQIQSGNLYTLTLPFQMVSTLFIDQSILIDILNWGKSFIPFINKGLNSFLVVNIALILSSFYLGFVIKGKNYKSFTFILIISTFLMEILFYFLGRISMNNGIISFINYEGSTYLTQILDPTVYQAFLGGFYTILGSMLTWEWWKKQRDNKILTVVVAGWFWTVSTVFASYLSNYRWEMIIQSNDRYMFVSSLGIVVFAAGIFSLSFKALGKIQNLKFKLLSNFLLTAFILLITREDYKYLDQIYYGFNERGGSAYWQETMYRKFLTTIGKDNLKKNIFLYMVNQGDAQFNEGSFIYPVYFEIYYDEKGNLIRGSCNKVLNNNIEILKKAYIELNREKGFIFETRCLKAIKGTEGRRVFYPLSNFYAYKIVDKEFVDIKGDILDQLDQLNK